MSNCLIKARTALALGLINVARVAWYRLSISLGINPVRNLTGDSPKPPFFTYLRPNTEPLSPFKFWQDSALLFSFWPVTVNRSPPDWAVNLIDGKRVLNPDRAWWLIPDFDEKVGDIKLIWELSRMDWVIAFAQRARNGDKDSQDQLNLWLDDWCQKNPPFFGPNWKCGQEASIRVMHLMMAVRILKSTGIPARGLQDLVRLHLIRIAPTIQYAIAQDNNHGTSEAAALFMGGSWLCSMGDSEGLGWANIGRNLLENRVGKLIGDQGTFSQYSLNYHRVLLDTLNMVEVWRNHLNLPAFTKLFQERALAATKWLYNMIQVSNGDGPNVGANDGARLLQLSNTGYRDYRPSVQLGMTLFANQRAYTDVDSCNEVLSWLEIPIPKESASPPENLIADDGGFAILRRNDAIAMLRYPRFGFRPSQADALHLDLWVGGENLLRDAGTYSYNTNPRWMNYFSGTASHNTIQFDDRDQMFRLSRFLFGDWLKTSFYEPLSVSKDKTKFGAGYWDSKKVKHIRRISLGNDYITIADEISDFKEKAILRWRLMPGNWSMDLSNSIITVTQNIEGVTSKELSKYQISIESSAPISRCELVEGWESRHYLEKTSLPVLEVEVRQAGTFNTRCHWNI